MPERPHCIADELIEIGEGCDVHPSAIVGYKTGRPIADHRLVLGPGAVVRSGTVIYGGTTIEDEVFMAPGVIVANDPFPIHTDIMRGPTIKRKARIGRNPNNPSVEVRIPEKWVADFKPGRIMKMRVSELERDHAV